MAQPIFITNFILLNPSSQMTAVKTKMEKKKLGGLSENIQLKTAIARIMSFNHENGTNVN